MIRQRQKQAEEARKNVRKTDCATLIGCISIKQENNLSLDKLQMETTVRRLVQTGTMEKPFQHFVDGMWVHEWLNISHSRLVFLTLDAKEKLIQVFDKKGDIVRTISLKNASKLTLKVNKDLNHSR